MPVSSNERKEREGSGENVEEGAEGRGGHPPYPLDMAAVLSQDLLRRERLPFYLFIQFWKPQLRKTIQNY